MTGMVLGNWDKMMKNQSHDNLRLWINCGRLALVDFPCSQLNKPDDMTMKFQEITEKSF